MRRGNLLFCARKRSEHLTFVFFLLFGRLSLCRRATTCGQHGGVLVYLQLKDRGPSARFGLVGHCNGTVNFLCLLPLSDTLWKLLHDFSFLVPSFFFLSSSTSAGFVHVVSRFNVHFLLRRTSFVAAVLRL